MAEKCTWSYDSNQSENQPMPSCEFPNLSVINAIISGEMTLKQAIALRLFPIGAALNEGSAFCRQNSWCNTRQQGEPIRVLQHMWD